MVLEFLNIAGILLLVSCKLVSCKKKRVHYSAGPWRAIWGPGVIYGNGTQWGVRKILATTPSRLPESEENAPFKTAYLKKCCVKVMQKFYL